MRLHEITEAKSPSEVINPTKDSSPADLKAAIKYAKHMKAKMGTDKAKATYDKEIAQLDGWLKKKSVMKESKKTWMKDGVEMCSKECCGQPVTECTCGPDCEHCDCYKINEAGYGMRPGGNIAGINKGTSDIKNINKRMQATATNTNSELNIRAASANRRNNRLGKKIATGLPQRILNPIQPGDQQ